VTPTEITFEQIPESNPPLAVAYVTYRETPAGWPPTQTERISPDAGVYVDFDDDNNVLGIELVGVDAESMAVASGFASEQGFDFPTDLSGYPPPVDDTIDDLDFKRTKAAIDHAIAQVDRGETMSLEESKARTMAAVLRVAAERAAEQ